MDKYWLNTKGHDGIAMIHAASCPDCNDGEGIVTPPQSEHWHGAYATRGAAIDMALTTGQSVREADCIKRHRINPTAPEAALDAQRAKFDRLREAKRKREAGG